MLCPAAKQSPPARTDIPSGMLTGGLLRSGILQPRWRPSLPCNDKGSCAPRSPAVNVQGRTEPLRAGVVDGKDLCRQPRGSAAPTAWWEREPVGKDHHPAQQVSQK